MSMSYESLDESISAAVPDLDGGINTTRVQLAIINDETPLTSDLISFTCANGKLMNSYFIVQAPWWQQQEISDQTRSNFFCRSYRDVYL